MTLISNIDARSRIVVWLLFVVASLVIIITAPPLQTNLTQFLPNNSSQGQLQLMEVLEQGAGSKLIIIQLSASDIKIATEASKQLQQRLKHSQHLTQVLNGEQLISTEDASRLLKYRYLLSDETDFSVQSLHEHLTERLQELASPMSLIVDSKIITSDPTSSISSILKKLQSSSLSPHKENGVWFSKQQQSALLLAYTAAATYELNQLQLAIDEINESFDAINSGGLLTLSMSGAPVFSLQSRRIIKSEAERLSMLGSVGVILLLYFMFRSFRAVMLALLPMLSGVLAGMSAVILLFGSLHGITLVFGITLIGISVDYPIHLFSHLNNKQQNLAQKHVWKTLLLGAITTATGFTALLFSNFSALAQLGVFSCTGILFAILVTRFLLPVIAQNMDINIRFVDLFTHNRLSLRHVKWLPLIPLVFFILAAGYIYAVNDSLWEKDISRLNPVSEQAKKLDSLLKNELNAPDTGRLLVIQADSLELLLQTCEKLQGRLDGLVDAQVLKHYMIPTAVLPSMQKQLLRQSLLPGHDVLLENLQNAQQGLPFKQGLFEPFIKDVMASKDLQVLQLDDLKGTIFYTQLKQQVFKQRQKWFAMISLSGIKDEKIISNLAQQMGDNIAYLNIAQASSRIVDDYRIETISLSLLGAAVILLVLIFSLGGKLAARVALPVLSAVLSTIAFLSLLGIALSLFHIAALLLVLGIGLDYSLFINRTSTQSPLFSATLLSLLVCNLSTVLVFGLLASSSVPVLSAMGVTVFMGAILSLLFSGLMLQVD